MSAPKAPDPAKTAAAQATMNRQTAITQYGLDATDQITPQGTLSYAQQGTWADGTPHFTATTTYSPDQQKLYDQQTKLGGMLGDIGLSQTQKIAGILAKPVSFDSAPAQVSSIGKNVGVQHDLDYSSLAALPASEADFAAEGQQVQDALMSRIQPSLDRDRQSLETDLVNRGIRPGTAAYAAAVQGFDQKSNDARMQAILSGTSEQGRLYDQALQTRQQGVGEINTQGSFHNMAQQQDFNEDYQNAGLQNQARQQAIQEELTRRNQPMNEISALLSGTQVSNPSFQNTPQPGVQGVDYAGLVNQQYQAKMASYQNMIGGLFGLGSAAAKGYFASDRRVKTCIQRIGQLPNGLPVYRYNKLGRMEIGLMADEVEALYPHAVIEVDGLKMVNYAEALV